MGFGKSDERISESGAVGFGAVTESGSFLTMRHVRYHLICCGFCF